MTKLLVTRPREQAEALATRLRDLGHEVIVDPMLGIRFLDVEMPALEGVQAILLTSRNGAKALARATGRRDIGILAVGDATADAARAEGFGIVQSADGDAEDLIALAARVLSPAAGRVVHVSGHDVAEDVAAALAARGFEAARIIAYEAQTASQFGGETRASLEDGSLEVVLLHSPRAAKTFATLVEAEGLAERLATIEAFVLSEQVGSAVGHLHWRRIRVAAKPNEEALLELLHAEPELSPAVKQPTLPTAPPASSAAKTASGGFLPGLAAGLIAGAAAGAAVAWLLTPAPQQQQFPAGLTDRLAKLEQKATEAPRPAPPAAVDLRPLESRLAALEARPTGDPAAFEQRLAAVESRATNADALPPSAADVAIRDPDMTPRLEAAERQLAQIAERLKAAAPREGEAARIALVLAIAELAETVRSGAPYGDQLSAVTALMGAGGPATGPLAASAATGLPTLAGLQERFPATARAVMTAAAAGEGDDWLDHVRARIASAVVIRRTGDVPGETPDALVARAEAKLRQNDAAGAAAELAKLTGRPAEAAAEWLAAARRRADAEVALAALKRRAVEAAAEGRR